MGTSGSDPEITREDIRRVFSQLDEPSTPLTAGEIAEVIDCPRSTAQCILNELAERGEIHSKRVNGANRVWWQPSEPEQTIQQPESAEFSAFVSAVKDYAIFRLDPDGTIASWNDGAERIKGYQEDEIIGEHFSTFYTAEDRDEGVPETNLEAAATEGRTEDEGWRVRKDGSRFWANVIITAVRDDDGDLQGFTKVTRDMTERREYEQQLRQERDLVEQVLETVPVGIGVLDADGQFVRANSHMLDRHGIDESELSEYNLSALDVYDTDGSPIPKNEWPLAQVVETGNPVHNFQCQVTLPTGDRRWRLINAAPLDESAEDIDRVVVAVEDITEQKEHERQLRRERDQTEQLLRTAPIAIAVQNAEGETILANQRAQDALGISEQEILDNPETEDEWEISDANGDLLSLDELPSARVFATGEPVLNEELTIDPPSGEPMQFHINAAPIFDTEGAIERVIVTGEDITELKKREQQLERRKTELETELHETFNRVSDAFYALDDEWQFTHINDYAADLFRQPKEEMLEQEIWEVISDASEDIYREKFQTAMETQEPISFDVYEEDFDAWFEFNVYPSESGLSVYFQDVTDRVEYERELQKYETIVKTINDGIYVKNEDGSFTMVNEAYAELTGYDHETLVGEHASLVVDETTIQQAREMVATQDDVETENQPMEAKLHTADGGTVPVEGTFATLQTGNEQEEIGVVRDITDRKRRERALRKREQRLKRHKEYTDDILDAITDLFYLLDENGELQRWNETLVEVTGFSDAEIGSMHALEFFGEAEQEKISAAIADGLETGNAQVEAKIHTKDGERIPYEFIASTLEDPDGNRVLAGIGRDITDRREYENQLEESNERLEQFAYAASHDLQEPLRMVSSYLQLIDERYSDALDDDGQEFLEFAVDGAERMRAMIEGLLEYSRVETRGDPFEPVDLETVLADVRADLQRKIEESGAEVTADPLPRVEGDADQLRQVFQNLLDNAIEYSGDEPPQIHVAAEQNSDEWVISVSDEGIGIDPDDTERVFEVFQRLHSQEEHAGTGIGLALCRRIVERHGGEIWAESEPGEGTTFSFALPAAPDSDT